MRHLLLIEFESLITKICATMTNQAYGRGTKFSYKHKWEKGDKLIEDGTGKTSKNYYTLSVILTDKSENIEGKVITLYRNYYPINPAISIEKLEEGAYRELLTNGMFSLMNATYSGYLAHINKDVVKPEDVKINEALDTTLEVIADQKKIIIQP